MCIPESYCIVCQSPFKNGLNIPRVMHVTVLLLIRYLGSTTFAPLQSSLNFERHSENFLWAENRYEVNRRRRNSSDGLDSNVGRHYRGII